MKNKSVFTMINADNEAFYSKDERLNLLHLYITERVRGFDACGKSCYMSNEQFAKETRNSISTIQRAIKLLVSLNILWAGYHQESVRNKQRVLKIYNERLGEYHKKQEDACQNDTLSENTACQNDTLRVSNCLSESVKMTSSGCQNDALVYKEHIKSISLVTRNDAKPHPLTRAEHSSEMNTSYEEFVDEEWDTDSTPDFWDEDYEI